MCNYLDESSIDVYIFILYIYLYYYLLFVIIYYRKEDIEEVISYSKHNCLLSAIHPVKCIKHTKGLESKLWK